MLTQTDRASRADQAGQAWNQHKTIAKYLICFIERVFLFALQCGKLLIEPERAQGAAEQPNWLHNY